MGGMGTHLPDEPFFLPVLRDSPQFGAEFAEFDSHTLGAVSVCLAPLRSLQVLFVDRHPLSDLAVTATALTTLSERTGWEAGPCR